MTRARSVAPEASKDGELIAVHALRWNGKDYAPGETISLPGIIAEQLLATGAVKRA